MKIVAIAINTFREAIRNKILYSILLFAVLVAGIAALFGSVSIGNQIKFVKDFSLMSISVFGVVIAITLGVNLLNNELGKKTIFNILSKPVSRSHFITGKFLGLYATLTLIVTLMCTLLVVTLAVFEGHLDPGLLLAGVTVLLELMIIVAFALFFSSVVVTPGLAGMFTAAIFVAGRSAGYLHHFLTRDYSPAVKAAAWILSWIVPRLDRFNIANQVVYGDHIDPTFLAALVVYALAYTGVLLVLSAWLFTRREFK